MHDAGDAAAALAGELVEHRPGAGVVGQVALQVADAGGIEVGVIVGM